MTQPYCRVCGKPIRKRTTMVYVVPERTEYTRDGSLIRYVVGSANSKADCAKLTNQTVTAIKKNEDGSVHAFYEWDGERYVDEFFCTGTCARYLAYAAAHQGFSTEKWRKRQKQKEPEHAG